MEMRKSCVDCKATKTPLWRTGPAGPRSLCNACGIRYRKRKQSDADQQQSSTSTASTSSHEGDSINLKLVDYGGQMMIQRPESPVKKQRSSNGGRLREVEEAAFLLLSLSCDPVFA